MDHWFGIQKLVNMSTQNGHELHMEGALKNSSKGKSSQWVDFMKK